MPHSMRWSPPATRDPENCLGSETVIACMGQDAAAARRRSRVLRYLAGQPEPAAGPPIARDLALPRSSVYHLLRVLTDEGLRRAPARGAAVRARRGRLRAGLGLHPAGAAAAGRPAAAGPAGRDRRAQRPPGGAARPRRPLRARGARARPAAPGQRCRSPASGAAHRQRPGDAGGAPGPAGARAVPVQGRVRRSGTAPGRPPCPRCARCCRRSGGPATPARTGRSPRTSPRWPRPCSTTVVTRSPASPSRSPPAAGQASAGRSPPRSPVRRLSSPGGSAAGLSRAARR